MRHIRIAQWSGAWLPLAMIEMMSYSPNLIDGQSFYRNNGTYCEMIIFIMKRVFYTAQRNLKRNERKSKGYLRLLVDRVQGGNSASELVAGSQVRDVVPRVSIQALLQALLVEVVTNESDRASKNE